MVKSETDVTALKENIWWLFLSLNYYTKKLL